ncbi:sciellin isoform X6 [Gadus macrocephalus]|uniref:sciellin isoform X6 n=1 Tax=Gadus macrocephalus TaxID=80720 RepID=UPI0028CB9C32|nr:sciellin isoform X6 [Gadus macrocephalus]
MSYSYPKKFIPSSTSSTQVKTSRLKDNSWIRKDEEEDEDIDRDPNFGKTILGHVSTVTSDSKVPEKTTDSKGTSYVQSLTKSNVPENTTDTKGTSYVQSLTKRFSASQEELDKIGRMTTNRTNTNKRSTLPSPRSSLSSTSSLTESPKTSSTTSTTVSENGKKTETTTTTSTRSGTFTDRVFSDGKSSLKGAPYSPLSPSSTKVTETTITSIKGAEDPYLDTPTFKSKPGAVKSGTEGNTYSTTKTRTSSSAEDKLFDSLIPSIKSDPNSSVSTTVTTTSVVKVESLNEDIFPATPTTNSYSSSEDQLYDTLLPKSITCLSPSSSTTSITRREVKTVESSLSDKYSSYSPTVSSSEPDFSDKYSSTTRTYSSSGLDSSDKYSSTSRTYSSSGLDSDKYNSTSRTYSSSGPDSSYEYTTINSPSVYTTTSTTYKDSRMDDYLDGDSFSSKSNIQTLYSASERTVMEKDLCSYCRKPFNTEAKMVLDDMKINCHASCFKCEVCSNNLGNLKAGDSLWIYRRTVHCDRCFEVTREKWRR